MTCYQSYAAINVEVGFASFEIKHYTKRHGPQQDDGLSSWLSSPFYIDMFSATSKMFLFNMLPGRGESRTLGTVGHLSFSLWVKSFKFSYWVKYAIRAFMK